MRLYNNANPVLSMIWPGGWFATERAAQPSRARAKSWPLDLLLGLKGHWSGVCLARHVKGALPSTQADSSGQELARAGEENLGKGERCQQRDSPSKADAERAYDVGRREHQEMRKFRCVKILRLVSSWWSAMTMVETKELVMMSTLCCRATKQAYGQSLQMLADINDPFLFRHTLTPRSANLFQPPLCLPWSTSIFPMLKHVKPRCLPNQPHPF